MTIGLLNVPSLAAFEEVQTDARSYAMGGAWAALDRAGQANPAAIPAPEGSNASAGFALPFGMQDLATVSSACGTGRGRYGLGLGLSTLGNRLYRESSFRAAMSWRVHDRLSCGAAVEGYHLAIEGYGSSLAPGVDLGIQGRPVEGLTLGLAARNVNRPRIADPQEDLAQDLSAGLAYAPAERATTALQIQAQRGWPAQLRAGQEFQILKGIAVRAGYSTGPASVSGGVGLEIGRYSFGYAVRSHPELGLSHCLTLALALPKPAPIVQAPVTTGDSMPPRIVLNAAPLSELEILPGISRRQAEAIAALRDSLEGLDYLDQLLSVKGITRKKLERLAPFVDLAFDPMAPKDSYPIDINTASAEELAKLPGIGPMTARFIVSYRGENGPFRAVEDLMSVKGIGRKTFEKIRELVTAGPAE